MGMSLDDTYTLTWVLSISYFCIVIMPYLIFGFSYIPFIVSIPDLINLIFYPPVITLALYLLFNKLSEKQSSRIINYVFIILLVTHFVGFGFHWASNAIHETIKHLNVNNSELISYAYYLDEILGHKITYYPFYIILLLFLALENKYTPESSKKNFLVLNIPNGFLFGFSLLLAGIEGQSAYEILSIALLVVIILAFLSLSLKRRIGNLPFSSFILISSFTILVLGAIYWYLFGGFIEPSEIFKSLL